MADIVLLTGATGMIGYRVLVKLLELGYQVRTAVRNQAGFDKIKTLESAARYADRLAAVIVPDITVFGAYDDAVKGVKFIIHVASPLAANVPDNADFEVQLINPAVKGTIGMLESAQRSTGIQRIVITGSVSSTIGICDIGSSQVFDESRRSAESEGPFASSIAAYVAAKSRAFNAAHEWMEKHRPSFDVIHIQPTFVLGRDETVTDAEHITKGTNLLVMAPLLGYALDPYPGATVHLDDVASMHVLSLNPLIPGNQDFLASSEQPEGIEWARIFDIIETAYPKECVEGVFKIPTERPLTGAMRISSAKAEKVFGIKFKSFEDQVLSVAAYYLELLGKR